MYAILYHAILIILEAAKKDRHVKGGHVLAGQELVQDVDQVKLGVLVVKNINDAQSA